MAKKFKKTVPRMIIVFMLLCGVCFGADARIKDYIYKEPTHTESMEDVANWAPAFSSLADEETLVDYYETAKKSIAMTALNDVNTAFVMDKTLASPIDITRHDAIITFYIDPVEQAEVANGTLVLGDSSFANHVTRGFLDVTTPEIVGGWYTIKTSCAEHGVTTGSLALALQNFQKIRFTFNTTSAELTPTVIVDSLRFVPALPKATYFLTFDDTPDTDLLVTAYLNSKGLKGTFFCSPSLVGTGAKLTLSELTTMQQQGHLIGNHSWTHEFLLVDDMSTGEAIESIIKATDWLNDNGFTKGARIWAVPGGTSQTFGWANDWKSLKPYCDLLRHTGASATPRSFIDYGDLFTSRFDDPAGSENFLDQAYLDNGSLVILGFHSNDAAVTSGGELTQAFKDFIDLLASKVASGEAEVKTMDEIVSPSAPVRPSRLRQRYK